MIYKRQLMLSTGEDESCREDCRWLEPHDQILLIRKFREHMQGVYWRTIVLNSTV